MRSARPSFLLAALLTAIPALLGFAGCTEATAPVTASRLTIVQGHLQQAAAGAALPLPVVLRVIGTDGAPMPKVPVSFNVLAGGGAGDPATAIRDLNGEGKAQGTPGPSSQGPNAAGNAPPPRPCSIGR
ncbi:MAG: hypothetical protein IBJ19_10340, partial [Gemmatimonadaceae bacterium]|nr:hypothetical protein [Gemmatimonadaceae bacterium]